MDGLILHLLTIGSGTRCSLEDPFRSLALESECMASFHLGFSMRCFCAKCFVYTKYIIYPFQEPRASVLQQMENSTVRSIMQFSYMIF